MAYQLIKGEFHIFYPDMPKRGPEPDGDTLRFKPDNPLLLGLLERNGAPAPAFNSRGMVNLRLEGIDALETHYADAHQHWQLAIAARDALLFTLGFTGVSFWEELPLKVKSVDNQPVRGYILVKNVDPYGRPVAFVFGGEHPFVDGSQVWLDVSLLKQSINALLMQQGLVYPAFYATLPLDLKAALADFARQARHRGLGVWPADAVNAGQWSDINSVEQLQTLAMWPKLFRRLVKYFGNGFSTLHQLMTWLRVDPVNRDDRLILPSGEFGNMHDIILVEDGAIKLTAMPEDVVMVPDHLRELLLPESDLKPVFSDVRIVAALVNPIARYDAGEKITIINTSASPIDLGGWTLADKQNRKQALHGVIDPAGVRQVMIEAGIRLSNKGDTIVLYDEKGSIADQVSYGREQARAEGRTVLF